MVQGAGFRWYDVVSIRFLCLRARLVLAAGDHVREGLVEDCSVGEARCFDEVIG